MIDYITPAIKAIATLLGSRPKFVAAVKAGNIQSYTTGIRWPAKQQRGAADYPDVQIKLTSGRMQGYTGTGAMKTFGNTVPGQTPSDFATDDEQLFQIVITYDGLDVTLPNQLEAEVKAAFFSATINLGLSNVKMWGPISVRRDETPTGTSSNTKRLVQTFSIPITFRLRKADLIGQ